MTEWDSLAGEPIAPLVGPFPHPPFLRTWQRHRPDGEVTVIGDANASTAVVILGGRVRFAGEAHLTDYHSPLGADPSALVAPMLGLDLPLVLDSLPAEAADPLEKGFVDAGVSVSRSAGEPCMVLDLGGPGDDGWEAVLTSKRRHEVRRKRRRFADALGEPMLESDPSAFGRFVDLHRSADGAKGGFMTDEMAAFFEELLDLDGARLDVLRTGDGQIAAAGVGFEDDDAYYLYNSAFDPTMGHASPGIVLVDSLIRAESIAGRSRFDFLKGTESYKRRMGAHRRPLFALEVTP